MNATTQFSTYDEYVAQLDLDKVEQAASLVRRVLYGAGPAEPRNLPVAINYEPGNCTRYDLIFTRHDGLHQMGSYRVPEGLRDIDGSIRDGWTIVSKVNGSATWAQPFDLTPGYVPHWSYVASKTGGNHADAAALTALFRAIAGTPIRDGDVH